MKSMTGFGEGEALSNDFTVKVEIKSVNHRFKDLRFKMPSLFNSKELEFRKLLEKNFKRGSFEIYVTYKKTSTDNLFDHLDEHKVSQMIKRIKGILQADEVELKASPVEFLRPEFLKDPDDSYKKAMGDLAGQALEKAAAGLAESRAQEGVKLKKVIEDHIDKYREHFNLITGMVEGYQQKVEDKLKQRISDFSKSMQIDEQRYLQEVIYYMEKLDVGEEINRIKSHLKKIDNLLSSDKEVGRKFEFTLQELGRETNTIGSKSGMVEISNAVVEMKVQLEKMREQILNIE